MRAVAQRKTNAYRQTYADNQNISFLPAIMSTSNRMHGEFLRLLFLQAHRETEAHFTAAGLPSQRNQSESFRFKRAAFFYQCARQTERPARPAPAQGCVVWLRAQGCSAVTVFDPRLGVRTPVWLCGRHLPPAAQIEYAHDITALRELLRCRFA
jgi:hypothetical protein